MLLRVLFLMVLVGASPAWAQDALVPVRPLAEIIDGDMPRVEPLGPTNAAVVFSTSVPFACAILYGETPEFGAIATDADMAGGAIFDHDPIMVGLKPDTLYYWRAQGTAPDGTFYAGELQTFRTPKQVAAAQPNLASLDAGARVIGVSSNFGNGPNEAPWGANNALDGSRATAWSSSGDGNDAFIEIALADAVDVDEVEVWTRTMADGTAQIFTFTVTTDAGETFGPFELPDAQQAYRFPLRTTAKTLRLDVVDSSGGNVGLVEFQAFGAP